MGRKCSVENCTSDSTKPEHTGVTFHKVPHHSDVRPKWLSLCRIPDDKTNAKLLYVCSRHFLRADFCSFKGKKYMLRQGVLPSVFPWDKSRLEAIKAEVSSKKVVNVSKKKDKLKAKRKDDEDGDEVLSSKTDGLNNVVLASDVEMETDVKIEFDDLSKSTANLGGTSEIKVTTDDIKEEIDAFDQHQRSQETPTSSLPISFAINSRIEVLDNNNIWYPAKINEVDYEENEVLIHFEKFSNKYDEWISMTSPRLRPFQVKFLDKYEVGERCMAIWSDSRKFPATVSKILENDTYEVLFDDSFVKVVKSHKMSKMNVAKPAQSSPLFEPVRSTKQERREKKRKLNVAALFRKRARVSVDDKKNKASPTPTVPSGDDVILSLAPQEETKNTLPHISHQWHTTWDNGKPVGIESTIESYDGLRKSVIVPDPRLPTGWVKHLSQRITGNSAGKWDTVIVAPDGKIFRSKTEVKSYLDLHPEIQAAMNMFDFSAYRGSQKKKINKPKQKVITTEPVELPVPEESAVEEPVVKEEVLAIEEPPVSLKIIFENDSYKCPIEGCGKNFRRENLALMHVKHYHSEYTKYLDSTPNVADLAYARTVGESLDRSPGPTKSTVKLSMEKTPTTPKIKVGPVTSMESPMEELTVPENKSKDSEIIKLLSQKPADINKDIHPLPSGLPSSMYPDIKLKDLLGKTDAVQMRDDINIKNLCSSRPSHGIKTLLPVRPTKHSPNDVNEEKSGTKRKRMSSESLDILKGKTTYQAAPSPTPEHQKHTQLQLIQQPTPQPQIQHSQLQAEESSQLINHQLGSESGSPFSSIPSAFDLAPPPVDFESAQAPTLTQFDGVIIEGGKIIKLERMKQEEIINCTCGFMEEDGLMIQCELCLCWQHAYCNNIQRESEVPEKYICYICLHPLRERRSAKYLHDQEWLKQGVLPVASYHSKDDELEKRVEKLKKCHDVSGGILELKEYMHTLAVKLKIAEAKNHPKLYLWSKPWEKSKLPEKADVKYEKTLDVKPKIENIDHQYIKNELGIIKNEPRNDSMLMMILKSGKEEMPMLNVHSNMGPIIPQPEAAIDSDDCRLNLLDHIAHSESLIEERLDDFEKQLDSLEEGLNLELSEEYPKTRQTLQLLMRDLETLKKFSELPMA